MLWEFGLEPRKRFCFPQRKRQFHDSPIAQSVERRTVNPQVVGSSPTRGARILKSASSKMRFFFAQIDWGAAPS